MRLLDSLTLSGERSLSSHLQKIGFYNERLFVIWHTQTQFSCQMIVRYVSVFVKTQTNNEDRGSR